MNANGEYDLMPPFLPSDESQVPTEPLDDQCHHAIPLPPQTVNLHGTQISSNPYFGFDFSTSTKRVNPSPGGTLADMSSFDDQRGSDAPIYTSTLNRESGLAAPFGGHSENWVNARYHNPLRIGSLQEEMSYQGPSQSQYSYIGYSQLPVSHPYQNANVHAGSTHSHTGTPEAARSNSGMVANTSDRGVFARGENYGIPFGLIRNKTQQPRGFQPQVNLAMGIDSPNATKLINRTSDQHSPALLVAHKFEDEGSEETTSENSVRAQRTTNPFHSIPRASSSHLVWSSPSTIDDSCLQPNMVAENDTLVSRLREPLHLTETSNIVLKFKNADEAEAMTSRRAKVLIPNDDYRAVKANEDFHLRRIMRALTSQGYEEPPLTRKGGKPLNEEQKVEWDRWQKDHAKKCLDILRCNNAQDEVEARARRIFEEVLTVHEKGLRFNISSTDKNLKCSERLNHVIEAVENYAIVRYDVFEDGKIHELAAGPLAFRDRKISNLWINMQKKKEKGEGRRKEPKVAPVEAGRRDKPKAVNRPTSSIIKKRMPTSEIHKWNKEQKRAAEASSTPSAQLSQPVPLSRSPERGHTGTTATSRASNRQSAYHEGEQSDHSEDADGEEVDDGDEYLASLMKRNERNLESEPPRALKKRRYNASGDDDFQCKSEEPSDSG